MSDTTAEAASGDIWASFTPYELRIIRNSYNKDRRRMISDIGPHGGIAVAIAANSDRRTFYNHEIGYTVHLTDVQMDALERGE